MCQVLATRAWDQGSRPQPSLLAETLGKDLQAPEPTWPPTPGSLPSHAAPAHRSVASTSPTAATRGSSAPCSCPPSPPCAPTPSPGPTTSANETKANRLGPGRPRPGPPPHPDPARHDPRWSPLRPTTNHETTHRRLTHHIGAPPCVWLHTRRGNRYVTVMIDLTPVRDRSGPARLLDVVPGRSKKALQDLARRSGRVLAWAGRGGSHGAGSPGSRALQARSSHRPGR